MSKTDKPYKKINFSLIGRLKSIRDALNGTRILVRYEYNARIHLFILVIVTIAGILFRIKGTEWLAILFVSGLVFVSECFNTAVEYLSDLITNEPNENIRMAKDVAAAGVLISATISVVTGLIIFIPDILRLFRN
jgi:diacylglycerol kinase